MNSSQNSNSKLTAILLTRLDRLPGWPFHWYILAIIGMSYFFSFYDIVIIATVLPKITQEFHVSQSVGALAITVSLIGYILGAFLIGQISDRFGRRLSLFISISFYCLGTLLCAVSYHMTDFLVWRLLSGIGIGAELACAVSYISELSPAASRGRNTTIASSCGFLGFAITPFIAMFVLNNLNLSWRVLFVVGGISGLTTFILRYFIPRSPRWLIQHRKFSEAETIIQGAESYVKNRHPEISLPPINETNTSAINKKYQASVGNLLRSKYLKNLLLILSIFTVYYIGNYGWLTLNVSLFTDIGFTFANSIRFICLSSLGFIAGSIVAIWIADKVERKWFCVITALIWATSLFIIAFWPSSLNITIFGFIACATVSANMPIMYSYAAENFPTEHRATAVAFTDGIGHIGGAFSGQIIFAAYYCFHSANSSFAAAFSVMALSGVITAILFVFGKNTTGQRLD